MAATALTIGLTGCGGAPEKLSGTPVHSPGPVSAVPVASGGVSRADYESAVAAMGECLAEKQVQLVNMGWNPIHQQRMVIYFRNTGMSDDEVSRRGDECRGEHLERVERQYVRATAPVMERKLLDLSRTCLSRNGMAVTGKEENGPDLLRAAAPGERDTVLKCVAQSAARLYPDFPIPLEM